METIKLDIDSLRDMAILYATKYGLNLVLAILIFFVGKWLAARLTMLVKAMMKKAKIDPTLIGFAGHVINAALLVFVVIAALSQLGIETTSMAAALAAAGLAVGLALQGSLSNLAAGVMIILFRPFKVGDYVNAAGTEGQVEEISIFTTNFTTPDNKHVIVPNNEITSGIITNFTMRKQRRIDMVIGVSYSDDLAQTRKVIAKVLTSDPRVLKNPEYVIGVAELADSSVNFVVRPWVKTEDYWPARFDLLENIKVALDKAGITIPFPQRDLHIIDGGFTKDDKPKKSKPSTKAA